VRFVILSGALLAAVFVTTPWIGPGELSPSKVFAGDDLERRIFVEFRLSRTLLAMLAGGSLSLAGCLFQAMLRNSLATPYTLGVSGGAALGAVLLIILRVPHVWIGATVGSLGALLLVLGFASAQRSLSAHALILAGVAIHSVCSALIMLIHNFAGFTQAFSTIVWLTGAVDGVGLERLVYLAAVVLPIAALIVWKAPAWNLLAVGEQWAAARGAGVRRLMLGGYLAGSLLTAATVSLTGPIGFVGLLVPHIVRLIVGPDHRLLMPCSLLCGAAFLSVCDAVGRTVLAPADLPVGVITALIGGPGLVWMLRSRSVRSA
jgi:iron complex transport system permease protein